MSRVGKMPIVLPKNVEVKAEAGKVIVKGPKGEMSVSIPPNISVAVQGGIVLIQCTASTLAKDHGLYRALIASAVKGVHEGYEKKLALVGIGYRASMSGQTLNLQLGFSHPLSLAIPKGLQVKVDDKNTNIAISGVDKRLVGQFAADVRMLKKPEPYKGKGVRYEGEFVRKKAGKAAKGKTA